MGTCRGTESSTGPTCLMEVSTPPTYYLKFTCNLKILSEPPDVSLMLGLLCVTVHPPGEAVVLSVVSCRGASVIFPLAVDIFHVHFNFHT